MTSQPAHAPQTTPADSANKTALGKARAEVKDALARVKAEEKARKKAEESLSSCQEDIKVLQAELDRERQLRSQVEQELVGAQETTVVEPRTGELVDEPLEPRTEESSNEFPEPVANEIQPAEVFESDMLPLPDQPAQLIILGVWVHPVAEPAAFNEQGYNQENQARVALKLNPEDRMILQTRFTLEGPGAARLTVNEFPFEIEVYAREVLGHASALVASHKAKLVKDTFEYSIPIQLPGLPAGLYRLQVVIKSGKLLDYRNAPVIQVE